MPERMNMSEAINRALHDAMERDSKVLVLGEEVADAEGGGVAGVTKGLSSRFGEGRVLSTPISEQAIVGAAIGAAIAGYRPVAELMLMSFSTLAMDMIVNHAAKMRYLSGGRITVPMVVRAAAGAGVGTSSDFLEAWFAHTAGIKVVIPSNPSDAYGLMLAAIDDQDPVIFVENISLYHSTEEIVFGEVPIGKAKIIKEGQDLTILSYARMLKNALSAAEEIGKEGASAEVIDLRTISPWDRQAVIESVRKTGRLLIVHEAVKDFGIGAEISSVINEELFGFLKAPIRRLGGAFCPIPFSKPLEDAFVPDRDSIMSVARTMLQ